MRHPFLFCMSALCGLLGLTLPTLRAQGPSPSPELHGQDEAAAMSLSLSEALRLGEAHVPVLVRARAEQRNVASRRAGAALPLQQNPLFTFLGGYRRETTSDPVATGFQYQVHLEQQIEIAGQRQARLAAVAAALQAAQAGTEYARTLARALVHTAYIQAVLYGQRADVARRREEFAAQLLSSAMTRQQLGATGAIEVNLARIEAGQVARERTLAEVALAAALAELRILCGLPPGQPLRLSPNQADPWDPPTVPPVYQDLARLLSQADAHRADLLALRTQRRALSAERTRLRREAVPSPILAFDHQRDLPGQDFYGGTVGLTLPLWNRNQGPLSQVAAAELARQAEEDLLLTRIKGEVTLAHKRLLLLISQAQSYRQTVLPPAEENLGLLRRGWQAGKFDLFRVITASRELSETRLRYLELLGELWGAIIDLERSVGTPILTGDAR